MHIELQSPGKINLTLRVVGKNCGGYHRLVSVFHRLPALERVAVGLSQSPSLVVHGIGIRGVNLVDKILGFLKKNGDPIPPLSISLYKSIPPGTGLGAGTGNGASVYKFLKAFCPVKTTPRELKALGADLPFLGSDMTSALVTETGEDMKPLDLPSFSVVLAIPKWRSKTLLAYRDLDSFYSSRWPVSEEDALIEARSVLSKLKEGLAVGLLPNDFTPPLVRNHRDYDKIFKAMEDSKALAWGISGSGSSAFGLYRKHEIPKGFLGEFYELNCTEKIIILE